MELWLVWYRSWNIRLYRFFYNDSSYNMTKDRNIWHRLNVRFSVNLVKLIIEWFIFFISLSINSSNTAFVTNIVSCKQVAIRRMWQDYYIYLKPIPTLHSVIFMTHGCTGYLLILYPLFQTLQKFYDHRSSPLRICPTFLFKLSATPF